MVVVIAKIQHEMAAQMIDRAGGHHLRESSDVTHQVIHGSTLWCLTLAKESARQARAEQYTYIRPDLRSRPADRNVPAAGTVNSCES